MAGDIHDIGKNMFSTALRTFGFSVIDLGVDVAPEQFLEEVQRSRPDVLCLSGLITTAYHSMKHTVELIRANGAQLDFVPPIVLGGATIDDEVCHYAGADSWSTDAMEGVRICERLASRSTGPQVTVPCMHTIVFQPSGGGPLPHPAKTCSRSRAASE